MGIIHMNGRVYSPSLGRILSPDPMTQTPSNAQNYNRYAYAFNNPLKYVDSTGHIIEEVTVTADDESGQGREYDSWDNGVYTGKGPHALDQFFAAMFAYNMGAGFTEKHPNFKATMQSALKCWRGGSCEGVPKEILDILVEHRGDSTNHYGEPVEELIVTGRKSPEETSEDPMFVVENGDITTPELWEGFNSGDASALPSTTNNEKYDNCKIKCEEQPNPLSQICSTLSVAGERTGIFGAVAAIGFGLACDVGSHHAVCHTECSN